MKPETIKRRQAPMTRDEFAALWASDKPTREIVLLTGRSTTNLQLWAKRFGLPVRPQSTQAIKQSLSIPVADFVALWNSGTTVEEISRRIGMTPAGIQRHVKELGLKRRCVPNDERLPAIREEFERLWMDPLTTCRQIAKRYGVHRETVGGWARVFKLPPKPIPWIDNEQGPLPGDPTPEEIAERAAECRARRAERGEVMPC